jgi:hypothetical protein
MADKKITDFGALTSPAGADILYLVDVSDTTDSAAGTSKKITVIDLKTNITTRATTTYTVLVTDEVVFANTDGAAWTATLPAGAEGQSFRIINSGSTGNTLTIASDGTEHLIGSNTDFDLDDGESLEITWNATDGWY